jgi:hypothetical protein
MDKDPSQREPVQGDELRKMKKANVDLSAELMRWFEEVELDRKEDALDGPDSIGDRMPD